MTHFHLPQMEALLGGISADGENTGCTKPFAEFSFQALCVAEPCFDLFSPINRSGPASVLSHSNPL